MIPGGSIPPLIDRVPAAAAMCVERYKSKRSYLMRCVWPDLLILGSTLMSVPLLSAQSFTFGAQKTLSLVAPSLPTIP